MKSKRQEDMQMQAEYREKMEASESYEESMSMSGTFKSKSFKGGRSAEKSGKVRTYEKRGFKKRSEAQYEIVDEGEHVYIFVGEMKYELFEGDYYWYYIDDEGEKHYVGFERKREWVSKDAEEFKGYADERWAEWEERDQMEEEQ